MQTLHTLNIFTHILFGTLALVIGLIAIFFQNNVRRHIRFGRYFLYCLRIVVGTAFIGIIFFRSNPFLLMLTLLGGYVGYSGYRAIRLKERKSPFTDVLITIGVLVAGGLYLRSMQLAGGNWSPTVVYSTLSALALVCGYDLLKYFWLHKQLKTWWLYEHIYKMLSAYSAIFSAFAGTVLPHYKPYSQVLPSILCIWAIIYFIWKRARTRRRQYSQVALPQEL
ncbi:hypothetical protein IC229_13325 [Spirosoma sp. BT702]|uniref:DUF2306 domain-containing protein n=1 Tax=Spirosoma profusum TaxID=2771354 RepID=A0A926XX34_9BACT|nr:hypothetical protein [Spirosoma profusum]MBD2701626.1 hypothetical protein [Spirosoma profusum]